MKVKDLITKLSAISDQEQDVVISIYDGKDERHEDINGIYQTADRNDFNITAIVLTNIENPTSI